MNDDFRNKIISIRGDVGKKWLDDLPGQIKKYAQEWNLEVFPPFQLSYNYVAPAKTTDGEDVVLKISFPNNDEFEAELEALKFYDGVAAVKVLKEDLKNGVSLLEKAEPGQRARDITPEDKQIHIVSEVINKLHKPLPTNLDFPFKTIYDWAKVFDRYKDKYSLNSGPIPKWMFDEAEGIFNEYTKDNRKQFLLHGDLHNDNILSSQRGWIIIDPKGVIGEREFELGAFLRNPIYDYPKDSDYKKLEARRIIQFSEELGFERQRLLNWAFACAVISLLWSLEDENKVKDIYIQNAEILKKIKL